MLVVVPFHNLELSSSDDPPLGVDISSRLTVNCIPIELFTFSPPVRNSPEGVLIVVYWLLYPHLTGHQIFNPFDVPIICRLRLSYRRCIFTARCTSPKILEVVVDEVFEQNYQMTSIIRYQRQRLQQIVWILLTFGIDPIQLISGRFVDLLQMILKLSQTST
nr:hypothetical protein [Tanacetum cinerariifolium]